MIVLLKLRPHLRGNGAAEALITIVQLGEEEPVANTITLDGGRQKLSSWIRETILSTGKGVKPLTLERKLVLPTYEIEGLRAGEKGLFSVIINKRKLAILETEFAESETS